MTQTPPGMAYSNQLLGDFVMSDFIVADWTTHAAPLKAPTNRPNVLTAYCPLTAAERMGLLAASLDDWQARILAEFDKCIPGLSKSVAGFYLYHGAMRSPRRRRARSSPRRANWSNGRWPGPYSPAPMSKGSPPSIMR